VAPGGRLLAPATVAPRALAATSSFYDWAISAQEFTDAENPLQRKSDPALARTSDRHAPATRCRCLSRTPALLSWDNKQLMGMTARLPPDAPLRAPPRRGRAPTRHPDDRQGGGLGGLLHRRDDSCSGTVGNGDTEPMTGD